MQNVDLLSANTLSYIVDNATNRLWNYKSSKAGSLCARNTANLYSVATTEGEVSAVSSFPSIN